MRNAETSEKLLELKWIVPPESSFPWLNTFQKDLPTSVHNFFIHHIARALRKKPVVAYMPPVCLFDSTEKVIFYQFQTIWFLNGKFCCPGSLNHCVSTLLTLSCLFLHVSWQKELICWRFWFEIGGLKLRKITNYLSFYFGWSKWKNKNWRST